MKKILYLGISLFSLSAVVGTDFVLQAEESGKDPQAYALAEYQLSVSERFDGVLGRSSDKQVALTEFLPTDAESWTVEPWSARKAKALKAERDRLRALAAFDDPTVEVMEAAFPEAWHPKPVGSKRGHTLIFTKGTELIEITIKRNPKARYKIASASEQVDREGYEHVRFGYIRGVDYIESIAWSKGVRVGAGTDSFRSIAGHLNGDVLIAVSAIASSSSIKSLLARIDYNEIEATLMAEKLMGRTAEPRDLPQIDVAYENRKRGEKRIQVNPQPAERDKPSALMEFLAALF